MKDDIKIVPVTLCMRARRRGEKLFGNNVLDRKFSGDRKYFFACGGLEIYPNQSAVRVSREHLLIIPALLHIVAI